MSVSYYDVQFVSVSYYNVQLNLQSSFFVVAFIEFAGKLVEMLGKCSHFNFFSTR